MYACLCMCVCFSLFVPFVVCVFLFNFIPMPVYNKDQLDEPFGSSGSRPFHC